MALVTWRQDPPFFWRAAAALNAAGVALAAAVLMWPGPLTWALAAATPLAASLLRFRYGAGLKLGSALYSPFRRIEHYRPWESIALLWAAPGIALLLVSTATFPPQNKAAWLDGGAALGVLYGGALLVAEPRLRNLGGGVATLGVAWMTALGAVGMANLVFDRTGPSVVRGIVTGGWMNGSTPYLEVLLPPPYPSHLGVAVSPWRHERSRSGDQVCVALWRGAFGWRAVGWTACRADGLTRVRHL